MKLKYKDFFKHILKEADQNKIYIQKGQQVPKGKKLQKGPRGGQFFIGTAQEKEKYSKKTSGVQRQKAQKPEQEKNSKLDLSKVKNEYDQERIKRINKLELDPTSKDQIKNIVFHDVTQGNRSIRNVSFSNDTLEFNTYAGSSLTNYFKKLMKQTGLDKTFDVGSAYKESYGSDHSYYFEKLKEPAKLTEKTKKNWDNDFNEASWKIDKYMPEDEDTQNEYHKILKSGNAKKMSDFLEMNADDRINDYLPDGATIEDFAKFLVKKKKK